MAVVDPIDETEEIRTFGELFPDGSAIDRVRGNKVVLWREGRAEVVDRYHHHGNSYVAAPLDPRFEQVLRLPSDTTDFVSVETLISDLTKLLNEYVGLSEDMTLLVAAFILSTWQVECFPCSPCLNVWGPAGSETNLMALLSSVCRHPLRVAEPSLRELSSLPSGLSLTLILKEPGERALSRLLSAITDPEVSLLRGGSLVKMLCATVVFTNEPTSVTALGVPLLLAKPPHRRLSRADAQQWADEFQPRLMRYRISQHLQVANSQFDEHGFAPASRLLARILGAAVEGSASLQGRMVEALRSVDEQAKTVHSQDLGAVVVEALLSLCHEQKQEAYVREITELANGILLGRHETMKLSPKGVGAILRKKLGLFTERHGAGYRMVLTEGARRRIHELAAAHHTLSSLDAHSGCSLCLEDEGPETARQELKEQNVQQVH